MLASLGPFLLQWGFMALSLWVASFIFAGISFESKGSLFVSALVLGLANVVIRPIFIFFTWPLTLVTFGFFILVINALMILLVSSVVRGFKVSGFWTAFFASIFLSLFNFLVDAMLFHGEHALRFVPSTNGILT